MEDIILSWGCYYGISENLFGPYQCCGSIIEEKNVDQSLRYINESITLDRHGSFLNGEINGISSVMKLVDPIIPTFVILQSHI